MLKFFYGIVVAALFCAQSADASCCSQASSGGVGRLLPHERALVQLTSSARASYGNFDHGSHFIFGPKNNLPHLSFDQELQAMFRLLRLEPFAKVAVRLQKSSQALGANVANSLVGTRIPLLGAGSFGFLPAIFMLASWEIPSGVASGQHGEYRAEYITSMGIHMLSMALFFEKSFDALTLGLGYGFSFEAPFAREEIVHGQVHSPSISMSFALDNTNFLTANLAATFVGSMHLDQEKIPDSSKRKVALSASYAKKIHSHITLLATIGSDVPMDYLGTNFKNEAFINLGMRLGVF